MDISVELTPAAQQLLAKAGVTFQHVQFDAHVPIPVTGDMVLVGLPHNPATLVVTRRAFHFVPNGLTLALVLDVPTAYRRRLRGRNE